MGIINKMTKRCIFCKSRGGTEYVEAFGMYSESIAGNWFHRECLREIACNPEKHSIRIVDMAIDIVDRLRESKIREESMAKNVKRRCDYIKSHCV